MEEEEEPFQPFRITRSAEGVLEVAQRVRAPMADVRAEEEEREEPMAGGEEDEEQHQRDAEEGGESEQEGDEQQLSRSASEVASSDNEEDHSEGSWDGHGARRRAPRAVPELHMPPSPRGGHAIAEAWVQKLQRMEKERFEGSKAAKSKKTGELPSEEELERSLNQVVLTKKCRELRNKLRELERLRNSFRIAAVPSHSIRKTGSKRLAGYIGHALGDEECRVSKLRLAVVEDVKKQEVQTLIMDSVAHCRSLLRLRVTSLADSMLPSFRRMMASVGPQLVKFRIGGTSELRDVGALLAALGGAVELKGLSLVLNQPLLQADADALGDLVSQRLLKLRRLHLTVESDYPVPDPTRLAAVLSCHVTTVILSGEAFCKRFFAAAKRETSVTEVLQVEGQAARCCFPALLLPRLKELHIQGCILGMKQCRMLGSFLGHPECMLERLRLSSNVRLHDEGFVARALLKNTRLRMLGLREDRKNRLCVLAALAAGSQLTEVKLAFRGRLLDCVEEVQLETALARCTLTRLHLSDVQLPMESLSRGLNACNSLKSLELVNFESYPMLRALEAEREESYDEDMIAALVAPFKKVPCVRLSFVSMPDSTIRLLLTGNTTLTDFDLAYNAEDVVPLFLPAIADCVNLRLLVIDSAWESVEMLQALVLAVQNLSQLRSLDIGTCLDVIDDDEPEEGTWPAEGGAGWLVVSLARLRSVQHLDVCGLIMSSATVGLLCETLSRNGPLESLAFESNDTEATVRRLGSALWSRNSHLTCVELMGDGKEAFQMLVQRNAEMQTRCRRAVMTFVAIRKYRHREAGWAYVPPQVVQEMAKYLWWTRFEWCWDTDPLPYNPYV